MLQVLGLAHESTLECIAIGKCKPDEVTMQDVAIWALQEIYSLRSQVLDEKRKHLEVAIKEIEKEVGDYDTYTVTTNER